jgi:hypothetical protein
MEAYRALDLTWVCSVRQRAVRKMAPFVTHGRVEWVAYQLQCQLSLYTTPCNSYFAPVTPWERTRVRITGVPKLQQMGAASVDIVLTQQCTYARPLARLPRRASKRNKRKRGVTAGPALDACLIWYVDTSPTRAQRALFHEEVARFMAALQAMADTHNT